MTVLETLPDHELLALLKHNDRAAYTEIYDRYERLMFLHAYKRLRNREEAKDIVQELFANLWTKRNELVIKSSLAAYFYASIRNKIFDIFAHQKQKSLYISSLQKYVEKGQYITDHKIRHLQLLALIEKEIALLPRKMREVFELSRNEFLSHHAIAEQLEVSEQTVKKQVQNALKILKVKLGPLFTLILF